MQTPEGAIKAKETMLKKYGLTEDGKSALHVRAGREGGRAGTTGGFFGNKVLARKAGARGGVISRRGFKLTAEQKLEARKAYKAGKLDEFYYNLTMGNVKKVTYTVKPEDRIEEFYKVDNTPIIDLEKHSSWFDKLRRKI